MEVRKPMFTNGDNDMWLDLNDQESSQLPLQIMLTHTEHIIDGFPRLSQSAGR